MRKRAAPDAPTPQRGVVPYQPHLFDVSLERVTFEHGDRAVTIDADPAHETVWMTQKQIAQLFGLTVSAVAYHIRNFKKQRKGGAEAVVKESFTTASDGKRYRIEHYGLDVIIEIGFRANANEITIAFRQWATSIIRERLIQERDRLARRTSLTRAQAVTGYILAGKSQAWAEARVDTKDTFKALTAQIARVCTSKRAFGVIAQREYVELLGATADELKRILGTTSIRDALPELTLTYLKTAEVTLTAIIERQQRMTLAQLQDAARSVLMPLGRILHDVCRALGIDRVTGLQIQPREGCEEDA